MLERNGNSLEISIRPELLSLNQDTDEYETAYLAEVQTPILSGDSIKLMMGWLSDLDKHIPSDKVRRALLHEDRLTLGKDPRWAERSDRPDEDRSSLVLIIILRIEIVHQK